MKSKIQTILIFSGIILLTVISYWDVLHAPFVFDDLPHIVKNPAIRTKSISVEDRVEPDTGISKKDITGIIGRTRNNTGETTLTDAALSYPTRPVPMISFALHARFFGNHPFGCRVVNLILHILCGILLFFFIHLLLIHSGITRDNAGRTAFFTFALFLLHPVAIQSVTYIIQRMNLLASVFFLAALFFHARARTQGKKKKICFFCAVVSALLAFFSKENTLVLPFVILAMEVLFFQPSGTLWKKNKEVFRSPVFPAAVAGYAAVVLCIGYLAMETGQIRFAPFPFTPVQKWMTAPRTWFYSISLIFFPEPQRFSFLYDYPVSSGLFDPVTTITCIGAWGFLLWSAARFAKKNPLISFIILWTPLTLAVESLGPVDIFYEHRLYLPSMVLLLVPGFFLSFLSEQGKVFSAVCILILFILFSFTVTRNQVWKSPVSLYADTVSRFPGLFLPRQELGVALAEKGDFPGAMHQLSRALRICPDCPDALNNFGALLIVEGRFRDAIPFIRESLRIYPDNTDARLNMAFAQMAVGNPDACVFHLEKALELNPGNPVIYQKLGRVYLLKEEPGKAIQAFQLAGEQAAE